MCDNDILMGANLNIFNKYKTYFNKIFIANRKNIIFKVWKYSSSHQHLAVGALAVIDGQNDDILP